MWLLRCCVGDQSMLSSPRIVSRLCIRVLPAQCPRQNARKVSLRSVQVPAKSLSSLHRILMYSDPCWCMGSLGVRPWPLGNYSSPLFCGGALCSRSRLRGPPCAWLFFNQLRRLTANLDRTMPKTCALGSSCVCVCVHLWSGQGWRTQAQEHKQCDVQYLVRCDCNAAGILIWNCCCAMYIAFSGRFYNPERCCSEIDLQSNHYDFAS